MMVRVRRKLYGHQCEVSCPPSVASEIRSSLRRCKTIPSLMTAVRRARQRVASMRSARTRRKNQRNSQIRWHSPKLAFNNLQALRDEGNKRVFFSTVVRHTNVGQCVSGELLTVALCHVFLRRNLEEGDIGILISCSPSTPNIQPLLYRKAVQGGRRIVAAFRVTGRESPSEYHTRYRNRPDQWYRKSRSTDAQTFLCEDGALLSVR